MGTAVRFYCSLLLIAALSVNVTYSSQQPISEMNIVIYTCVHIITQLHA